MLTKLVLSTGEITGRVEKYVMFHLIILGLIFY